MTLTKQARLRNPNDFPTLQLFLLGKSATSLPATSLSATSAALVLSGR